MNCCCCGKPIIKNEINGWHRSCVKRFFGTNVLPEIEINDHTLEAIAKESTRKGITVPGVQKKLSLHLHSEGKAPRLTLVNYPAGYILKPQVTEFECLPEAEQSVMSMAGATGIPTVPHALIKSGDAYAYITKRVDRIIDKNYIQMLAMEDFCQLDLRLAQDKYKGSYERCAKIIARYSSQAKLDMTELFMRLVFSFVVGNSDMHLKNFSLIETHEASGVYILSPAYDLLPVNVVLPEDREEFALAMNGKKTQIRKKDFLIFAKECGIPENSAEKMIARILSLKSQYLEICDSSLMSQRLKERFSDLIEKRCKRLE